MNTSLVFVSILNVFASIATILYDSNSSGNQSETQNILLRFSLLFFYLKEYVFLGNVFHHQIMFQ
jgi:hypothetical protein